MNPQEMQPSVAVLALLGLACWAVACGDGATEPPPTDPPRATTVTVTPPSAELAALGDTVRIAAQVRDQNAQLMASAAVTWSSGSDSVATVDVSGLVTATGNGEAQITATSGSASQSADVTVQQAVRAVAVSPSADTLVSLGDTARLAAEAQDANGHAVAGSAFTWASGDTAVATVDATGLITGVVAGEAEITARSSDVTGRAKITVVAQVPGVVAVTPDTVPLTALGQTVRLSAEVRDQIGRVMEGIPVSWASADTAVAKVDSVGLVTAVGGGMTKIVAATGNTSGEAVVTVMQSVASVVMSPATDTIAPGDTLSVTASPYDENGHAVQGAEFAWSSSHASVATVDGSGLVTGVAEGTASITAVTGDARGMAEIVVENPDRAALVALFEATDGPNWVDNTNWLTDAPLGEWAGVRTDAWGRVRELLLSDNGLRGTIPTDIGHLTNLETLDLAWNRRLTGSIPHSLTRLVNLRALHLQVNGISGTIPTDIGRELTKLEIFDLSWNQLTGRIPHDLSQLVNLRELWLGNNRLDGTVPTDIGDLTRLEKLDLSWNHRLEGPIPSGIRNLTHLKMLDLSVNQLSGHIPQGLSDLVVLEELSLGGNQLTGTVPTEISELARLQKLDLGHNRLASLPEGVFSGLAKLELLDLSGNRLVSLPKGVFSGLGALRDLSVTNNPGSPFTITVEMSRTDSEDPMAPGPATLAFRVAEGTPFPMEIPLYVRGGTVSSANAAFAGGATEGAEAVVTRDGSGAVSVAFGPVSTVCEPIESDAEGPRCLGLEFVAGAPLVLSNPEAVAFSASMAHLTQASQHFAGGVPLIGGRDALLRVFANADERYVVEDEGVATFFSGGREVYRTSLATPVSGIIPLEVDEGRLGLSFNARIPGRVLQPGIQMAVELDPGGALPLKPGSVSRFPASGRIALDVRELPPLDLTIVPVLFGSEARRETNALVEEVTRDMAGNDSYGTIHRVRGMLPIGDLNLTLREPYVTFADSSSEGDHLLFSEIAMLRHLEAAADEYYHGVFFHPRSGWRALGLGHVPGYVAISGIWNSLHGLHSVVAHELGHNLSLWHARCGVEPDHPAYYPHADGSIGAWGHAFPDQEEAGFGRLLDPNVYTEVMGTDDCPDWRSAGRPRWIGDYRFVQALGHRLDLAGARSLAGQHPPLSETLLLWGGVHGDSLRLEPAFAHRARMKIPDEPGPYRIEGLDAAGQRLFSLDFTPDELDHGNASFLFAIPFRTGWAEDLHRITLTGPEGSATLGRDAGGGGALIIDRTAGRVRTIVRDWTRGHDLPQGSEAWGDVEVIRGLPRQH